jgi:hypothetical protein
VAKRRAAKTKRPQRVKKTGRSKARPKRAAATRKPSKARLANTPRKAKKRVIKRRKGMRYALRSKTPGTPSVPPSTAAIPWTDITPKDPSKPNGPPESGTPTN